MRSVLNSLLIVVVLSTGLLWSAAPASAEPTMTVTPETGVIDGQTVIVRGEGYTPDLSSGTTLCSSEVLVSESPADCDGRFITTSTVAADGTTEIALIARRFIEVQGQAIDCAVAEACVVVLVSGTSIDSLVDLAAVPIQFDGTPIPPLEVSTNVTAVTAQSVTLAVTCTRPPVAPVGVTLGVDLTQAVSGVDVDAWPVRTGATQLECPTTAEVVVPLVPIQGTRDGKLTYPYRRLLPGPAMLAVDISAEDFETTEQHTVDLGSTDLSNRQSFDNNGVEVRVSGVQVNPGGRALATVELTCDVGRPVDVRVQALSRAQAGTYRAAFGHHNEVYCDETAVLTVELNHEVHPQRDDMVRAGPVEMYATAGAEGAVASADMRPVTTNRKMRPKSIRIRHHPKARITIQDVTTEGVTARFRCKRDATFSVYSFLGQPVNNVVFNDRGWNTMECETGRTVVFDIPWQGSEIRTDTRSAVVVRAINGVHTPHWDRQFQQNQGAWRTIS
ncbi:MAG: neocarzinostatin apoprotein domain-containing protein [Acidimicrobiales bacterium]